MAVASSPSENYVASRDGTRLFYRRWPIKVAKAALLIVHGYADHSGRYEHVAKFLNALGLDVFAVDVRGHGRSEGRRGHIGRFSEYLDDVDAMLALMTSEGGRDAPFILGHSNGGLIVLSHAAIRRPACPGLVITSPFLGVATPVPAAQIAFGRLMSLLWPSLALANKIPPGFLSHDSAVGAAYAADPLVFKTVTPRWFTEAMAAIEALRARAGEIAAPCLMLSAGDDRIADPRNARPLFERLGSRDKIYIDYPGFYHEILNEVDRGRVLEDIRTWLLPRL